MNNEPTQIPGRLVTAAGLTVLVGMLAAVNWTRAILLLFGLDV